MHRFVRSGVGVLLAVGMVAGCSSDNGGKPATTLPPTGSSTDPGTVVPPPTTTAPAVTVSPTQKPTATQPTKPVLPAVASQHTKAGAKAMAEYWLYAWDYSLGTADSAPMISVSASNCYTCNKLRDEGDSIIHDGGTVIAVHKMKLISAQVTRFSSTHAEVLAKYVTGQVRIRIPKQHFDELGKPPTQAQRKVVLTRRGQRWIVDNVYNA